ncbi:hypothetical protein, partial [Campylobacter fetus]|uniref:hypothetical protein n=1 Tax=Campylobacter fetus TaxID=196 RepID=UPI001EE3CA57
DLPILAKYEEICTKIEENLLFFTIEFNEISKEQQDSFFWAESLLIFIFLSIFIGIYYLIINDIEECKDKFILFSYTALSSFLLIFLVYSFTTVAL